MKLKTNKALLKRIKITGTKKIMRRPANQGHFNAKDSGSKTRNKRRTLSLTFRKKQIKKQFPSTL